MVLEKATIPIWAFSKSRTIYALFNFKPLFYRVSAAGNSNTIRFNDLYIRAELFIQEHNERNLYF